MNYEYEQNLISKGYKLIGGIDEAGRGPLAGPLVAGAVILDSQNTEGLSELKDSKLMTEKKRDIAFDLIRENALSWAVGVASNKEIDKYGLSYANKIAMKRAWKHLGAKPDFILSDYIAKLSFETPFELIIKGDRKILTIAAASIIAKVFRDRMMLAFARKYPEYEFEKHKGYGTKIHIEKINSIGPCEIHRRSFGPVKAKLF
jgi:ribonuclease HII